MELLLIIIIVILLVAIGALSYACYNLLKKIETYEAAIEENDEWLVWLKTETGQLYDRLKMVDDKNLFEKDDDVGFVFSEVVRIAKEFNDKVK